MNYYVDCYRGEDGTIHLVGYRDGEPFASKQITRGQFEHLTALRSMGDRDGLRQATMRILRGAS